MRLIAVIGTLFFASFTFGQNQANAAEDSGYPTNQIYLTTGAYPVKLQLGYAYYLSGKYGVSLSLSRQAGLHPCNFSGYSIGVIYRETDNLFYGFDVGFADGIKTSDSDGVFGELSGWYNIRIFRSFHLPTKLKVGYLALQGSKPALIIGFDLGFGIFL